MRRRITDTAGICRQTCATSVRFKYGGNMDALCSIVSQTRIEFMQCIQKCIDKISLHCAVGLHFCLNYIVYNNQSHNTGSEGKGDEDVESVTYE